MFNFPSSFTSDTNEKSAAVGAIATLAILKKVVTVKRPSKAASTPQPDKLIQTGSGLYLKNTMRLSDPAMQKTLNKIIDNATSSEASALAYLVALGTINSAGNPTRRYGGK